MGLVSAPSSAKPAASGSARKSDGLLWLAAVAVCVTGGGWAYVTKPWAGSALFAKVDAPAEAADVRPPSAAPTSATADAVPSQARANVAPATDADPLRAAEPGGADPSRVAEPGVADPLRMADLAFAAGMLVEPEAYSAWTLYAAIAAGDPHNAAAHAGLEKVATELARRAATALEQGRIDDARGTVERILTLLPEHAAAAAIAAQVAAIDEAQAAAERERELALALAREQEAQQAAAVVENTGDPATTSETTAVADDPVAAAHAAFTDAMAGNRLLTPVEDSAKRHLATLALLAPNHAVTRTARERLATELVSRSRESLEALDVEASTVWLAEAERAGAVGAELAAVRAELDEQIAAAEAARPFPASQLETVSYVDPAFPERALERGIEGWVDIEFVVRLDGRTEQVTVIDGSHESYFRNEAVAAVEQWRFEPRIFMGKPIAQRARTRIRFVP